MEELKKHIEESTLMLARVSYIDWDDVHDQLERLTRAACLVSGISFDSVMKQAQSVLNLEKSGLVKIQKP